jgi:hypothetical protein
MPQHPVYTVVKLKSIPKSSTKMTADNTLFVFTNNFDKHNHIAIVEPVGSSPTLQNKIYCKIDSNCVLKDGQNVSAQIKGLAEFDKTMAHPPTHLYNYSSSANTREYLLNNFV